MMIRNNKNKPFLMRDNMYKLWKSKTDMKKIK